MTDKEAMMRYIKAFNVSVPDFSNEAFWDKITQGTQWMMDKFPESPFADVAERYKNAVFMIACIRHEILEKRGDNIDRCRKEI